MKTQTVYLHIHYYSQQPEVGAAQVSTARWTDKQNLGCSYNAILFSLKGKGVLTRATAQTTLEDVMLIETDQSQKDKYYMFPLIRGP